MTREIPTDPELVGEMTREIPTDPELVGEMTREMPTNPELVGEMIREMPTNPELVSRPLPWSIAPTATAVLHPSTLSRRPRLLWSVVSKSVSK